jgi:flagellar biosynthetic protein FliR
MSVTDAQLSAWVAAFIWPLMRVSAMVVAAPVFSSRQLPARLRVFMSLILTWLLVPLLPPMPVVDWISHDALLISLQQILIGVSMGFTLQMVFAALVFGGQTLAFSMGLGFASMIDPQNGVQVPVISQYFLILATLVFLLLNGHLLLIELLADSFHTLPVAVDGIGHNSIRELVAWASRMFTGGLMIALPAVTALLLVNLGMGIITRAAPQLNIFAVGFPITILLGFAVLWLSLPSVLAVFGDLLDEGFSLVMRMLRITS